MALFNFLNPNRKGLNFIGFLIFFSLLLATLIYWREDQIQDKISFLHVVLWQVGIWIPWVLAFPVFNKINKWVKPSKSKKIVVLGLNLVWIGIHYIWFFFISSIFSPYLGMPATRYGVYPYFFIFWTLVDLGLMWYVLEKLKQIRVEDSPSKSAVIELTRGYNKHFCEPGQIHWLAGEGYYTKLHTDLGIFLSRKSLKHYFEILTPGDFKRIHRSTIININFVSGLARGKSNSLEIVLKDGTRRSVSRNYAKEIRTFFRERSL